MIEASGRERRRDPARRGPETEADSQLPAETPYGPILICPGLDPRIALSSLSCQIWVRHGEEGLVQRSFPEWRTESSLGMPPPARRLGDTALASLLFYFSESFQDTLILPIFFVRVHSNRPQQGEIKPTSR